MRPNSQRAKNAINALIATLIGTVITTILAYILLNMISNVFMNDDVLDARNSILTFSMIIGFVGFLQLGVYITCIVLFIMWFRRAYFNLHKLVPSSRLKYTEGWAAGAWFVPIMNLFAPYQIATDLFYESEKLLVENGLMDRQPKFHQVKGWWWALWISSIILNQVSNQVNENADFSVSVVIGILVLATTIGAGILAIQMIKNYTVIEEKLKQLDLADNVSVSHITNDDLLDSGI